jgi:hypothetical protein
MQQAHAEQHREHREMENFHITCIYELVDGDATNPEMRSRHNRFKANLLCLQRLKMQ